MRENGVNIPAPNTSGKGPIFNTQGARHREREVPGRSGEVQQRAPWPVQSPSGRRGATGAAERRAGAARRSRAGRRRLTRGAAGQNVEQPGPPPAVPATGGYGRFAVGAGDPDLSGIACELGLVRTVGVGSAATRVISWFHCAALSALVVTTGAGAVGPSCAECAAVRRRCA